MGRNLKPNLTDPRIHSAMAQMLEARDKALALGDAQIGWKAAITHPKTQAALGLEGPLVGFLLESAHSAENTLLPAPKGVALVELELALKLGVDLGESPSEEEALAAISGVGAALEVLSIDAPLKDLGLVAKRNAFHFRVRFSPWRDASKVNLQQPLQPRLHLNQEPLDRFSQELVIGTPAEILCFMSQALAPFGERLREGDCVICGSLNLPIVIAPGDKTAARLEGIGECALALPPS